MVAHFRDLIVWQKGMDLVVEVYQLLRLIPETERFALSDQMRRAAVSIPSNIAEGFGRSSRAEFKRFIAIALGSRAELQTQLLICERLAYLTREQTRRALLLTEEMGKMLHALSATLQQSDASQPVAERVLSTVD